MSTKTETNETVAAACETWRRLAEAGMITQDECEFECKREVDRAARREAIEAENARLDAETEATNAKWRRELEVSRGIYASHATWEPHSVYYGRRIFKATSWITRSTRWFSGTMSAKTLKDLKERIKTEVLNLA